MCRGIANPNNVPMPGITLYPNAPFMYLSGAWLGSTKRQVSTACAKTAYLEGAPVCLKSEMIRCSHLALALPSRHCLAPQSLLPLGRLWCRLSSASVRRHDCAGASSPASDLHLPCLSNPAEVPKRYFLCYSSPTSTSFSTFALAWP